MRKVISLSTTLLFVFSTMAGCIEVLDGITEALGCTDESADNFDPDATSGLEELCLYLENEVHFIAAMTDAMAVDPSSYLLDPTSDISGVRYNMMMEGIDANSGMSVSMETLSVIMVDLESQSMYNRSKISYMGMFDIDTEIVMSGTEIMVTTTLGGPMASEVGELGSTSLISRDMTPNLEQAVRAASLGLSSIVAMEDLILPVGMGSMDEEPDWEDFEPYCYDTSDEMVVQEWDSEDSQQTMEQECYEMGYEWVYSEKKEDEISGADGFEWFDRDSNGFVVIGEVRATLHEEPSMPSEVADCIIENVESVFIDHDANRDDMLNEDEFRNFEDYLDDNFDIDEECSGRSTSTGDSVLMEGMLPEDASVVISHDPETGLQSMTANTTDENGVMTMIVRLYDDGSFHSYDMTMDGHEADMSMSFAYLSADMISIPEIDRTLDRTATPISVEVEVMVVCDDGGFIPEWAVMDGWEDCEDGSDEADEEPMDGYNGTNEANDLHWEPYPGGHCEWEGNPDDGEDVWSCAGATEGISWDNWWYYCELHGEGWFCTDGYGQDPGHEYSAGNAAYNESDHDGLDWEPYPGGHCEWEGNPDDGEDVWSCAGATEGISWDNWWYYCELHGEGWFCTDGYGQDPGHEYSAGNENYIWIDGDNVCIWEDEDGVVHYDCEEDDGGSEYPVVMHAQIVNQIYNAPITDFELRVLDCDEVGSEDHSEPVWDDCSVVMSFPLSGGAIENVTVEFFDIDGDGMVSSGDISAVGFPAGFDHDYEIQPYDTWAEEYSADSALVGPELPGFGAFLSIIGLLGAALAGRHEKS